MPSSLSQNHYELFGLPVAFDVDVSALSERYRELQRAIHPDKYASASDQQRRLSVQRTAQVNEAFRTLKDPLSRARYLLQLHGVATDEETDTAMDAGFLMEQMELREGLQEVRHAADPHREIARLLQHIDARTQEMIEELRRHFADASPETLAQARDTTRKMQFIKRLKDEVEELEEELL